MIIDGTTVKGIRIIEPASLQDKAVTKVQLNHMIKEKIKLLACESIPLVNMHAHIDERVKNCPTCLDFQST